MFGRTHLRCEVVAEDVVARFGNRLLLADDHSDNPPLAQAHNDVPAREEAAKEADVELCVYGVVSWVCMWCEVVQQAVVSGVGGGWGGGIGTEKERSLCGGKRAGKIRGGAGSWR